MKGEPDMAKYNITQIQKMVDRLAKIGINTEKSNIEYGI